MSVTEEPGNGLAPGDQAQGDQARGDQARGDKALGEKDNRAYSRIYQKAIRMLASREHSRRELLEKLTRKSSDVPSDCIEQVLDALAEQGLQCDVRYAESLIRSRINRGYGPYYIRQELRSKGVAESVLQACEDWQHTDWLSVVVDLVERKHPDSQHDQEAWHKAYRFLQRRGFDIQDCREALGEMPN